MIGFPVRCAATAGQTVLRSDAAFLPMYQVRPGLLRLIEGQTGDLQRGWRHVNAHRHIAGNRTETADSDAKRVGLKRWAAWPRATRWLIGGIYALERVARESAKDQPTVMEVLTAFVRQYSPKQWPETGSGRWTRPDVQAAVTVVGRRAAKRDIRDRPIDLYRAVLVSANLNGANLRGATLRGATLRGADLRGAILVDADLRGVTLRDARHSGADLTGAKWSRSAPVPEGWKLGTGSDRLERQANGTSSSGQAAAN